MCSVRAYITEIRTSSGSIISGSGRPIPDTSTTDALKYLCISINFLVSWFKSLGHNVLVLSVLFK